MKVCTKFLRSFLSIFQVDRFLINFFDLVASDISTIIQSLQFLNGILNFRSLCRVRQKIMQHHCMDFLI